MSETSFILNLKAFGLTGQEALIYETLLKHGPMSGYEVAKETGISRSNAYSSLSTLVEKGAAFSMDGDTTRYTPEDIKAFSNNRLRDLSKRADELVKSAPKRIEKCEGYITISGSKKIKNKIEEMLDKCELRLYILSEASVIEEYRSKLEALISLGKKVVILSDGITVKGAEHYRTKPVAGQLRFITDSSYVLTGTLTGSENDACLYSAEQNLVSVMKEALKNKITLIENNMEENT